MIRRFISALVGSPRLIVRSVVIVLLIAVSLVGLGLGSLQLWALYQFRAGRSALEHYRHAEARTHLQESLKVWPADGDALLLAARANRRLGDFDATEELLDRYRQARGQTDELFLERVLLRVQRGEVD